MVTEWPALNALAWLRLPCCGSEHPTRVEDIVDDYCVVAAPVAPHTEPVHPPREEQGFFIGWVGPQKAALEAPVLLVETANEPVNTWTIRSIGEPVETQRRNYVRLQYETNVSLYLYENGPPVKSQTLDISEGGVRIQVDKWALDPGGRIFSMELPFEGQAFTLKAQVAWWGNLDEKENRLVGIRFLEVEQSVADEIRKHIFNAQLEERRRRNA